MRVIRFVKKMRFVKWFKFAKLVPAIRAWRARQAMAVDIGSPLIAASELVKAFEMDSDEGEDESLSQRVLKESIR